MFKHTMIAGLTAAALGSGAAQAQQPPAPAPAPAPEYTFTGNFGYFSQYIFRGLTQTNGEPAAQGGFDFAHQSGFYVGTWASNISWLRDFGAYTAGGSVEIDIYGGYKGTFAGDFGYDAGLLFYWYPGDTVPGGTKADTLEVYGAISWKWLSAKLSYVISDEAFGVANADGTYYLDLTANFPIPDTKLTVVAHYGIQKFSGNTPAGVSNDSFASYEDYKLGLNYSLPKDYTVGVFYSNTSMDTTQKTFYTTPAGAGSKELGKDTVTLFLQKTF